MGMKNVLLFAGTADAIQARKRMELDFLIDQLLLFELLPVGAGPKLPPEAALVLPLAQGLLEAASGRA